MYVGGLFHRLSGINRTRLSPELSWEMGNWVISKLVTKVGTGLRSVSEAYISVHIFFGSFDSFLGGTRSVE